MVTQSTIEFDFQRAKQQADNLENLVQELKKLSTQSFEGTITDISSSWKGENSNAYLKKSRRLQNDMNVTTDSLVGVVSDIREIARKIYQAEMSALEIIETRTY